MAQYTENAGAVFSLKYHLVWCPKYRLPVLVRPVEARSGGLLKKVATEHDMVIHALEVMPDHLHMLVAADPTMCIVCESDALVRKARRHPPTAPPDQIPPLALRPPFDERHKLVDVHDP